MNLEERLEEKIKEREENVVEKPKYFLLKYFTTIMLKNLWLVILFIIGMYININILINADIFSYIMLLLGGIGVLILGLVPTYSQRFYFDIFNINEYMDYQIEISKLKKNLKDLKRQNKLTLEILNNLK